MLDSDQPAAQPLDKTYRLIYIYILSPLAILALVSYCYSDTFNYPFHFDDEMTILNNDTIRELNDIGEIWSYNPARFLTFYSLAVNYHLGGFDVFGYHVFNFAVHFINALLVFWLARILFSTEQGALSLNKDKNRSDRFLIVAPLLAAVLFAVHPLQTEAVTYIWQRNTSLAALFYILSMALYLKSSILTEEKSGEPTMVSRLLFTGALAAAVAAMLTKQFSITLPIVIVMLEWFFVSGSIARLKEKTVRLAAFIPTMMIIPVLTAMGKNQEINHIGERSKNILSHYEYLLTQFNVIVTYLRLLLVPVNQNIDYNYPVAHSFADSYVSFFGLIFMAGGAIWLFNKNRIVSFGILFFFIAMSVESSIFPLEDIIFEHRVYLPSVGLFIAAASALSILAGKIYPRSPVKALAVALVVLAAVYAQTTKNRNYVWKTHESLWKDVVKKSPDKARGNINLGVVYMGKREYGKAQKMFERAVELKPGYTFALYDLGRAYEMDGKYGKAMETYKKALKTDPAARLVHYAIANLYMRDKIYSRAVIHYRIGLTLEEEPNVKALLAFGTALMLSGQIDKSIKTHKLVLKIEPNNKLALNNLGALYLHNNDREKAASYFKKAREHGYNVTVPGF